MELHSILMELDIAKLQNPFLLSLLLLLLLLSFLLFHKQTKRNKLNLPPSPPKLPIIGNIHQLGKLPHRSLRNLSKKYGSLLLMQLGHNSTLVISSADMAKEITKNHDIIFSNRPNTTAAKILLYDQKDMGYAPYGPYWRQVRRISSLELFSLRRVQSFRYIREEETEDLINKIFNHSVKGEGFNLSELLMAVTNNIVSRCLVGKKFVEEDGSNNFGKLARRYMNLIMAFCVGDMFPLLRWMDVITGLIPKLNAAFKEMDEMLDQVIEEHRAMEGCDDDDVNKDFVSLFLDLQNAGLLEMDLTQENLKAILMDMFVGGTDTTSTLIEWVMAELLKHPNIMEKVQYEVRNVIGKKPKIDADEISRMKYLKCVIKETFRFHPPVPLMVPRETSASVKVGGYDIPSHVTVYFNIFAIQRDSNWWENPEEFIPERFENNPVDYKGLDFQFIPFGCGRRSCPGLPFGIAVVENVIANLLYWFDWKLPFSEKLDMDEVFGLTVNKKVPLRVVASSHLFT